MRGRFACGGAAIAMLAGLLSVGSAATSATATTAGTSLGAGAPAATSARRSYIVSFNDDVSDPGALAVAQANATSATLEHVYRHALKGYAATLTDAQAASIAATPGVASVEPDRTFVIARAVSGSGGSGGCSAQNQCVPFWALRVGADRSTTRSGDGRGSVNINVAVVDTGIDLSHPDLNVVGGVNCANGQSYNDVDGHGTAVAGVVAAKDNGIGVVGIAPGARLWSVRVLNDHGQGSTSQVLCGIDWITGTRMDSDPTNDIAVANMSFGFTGGSARDDGNCGYTKPDALHQAICRSTAAGITDVVAAANETQDLQGVTPAAYDEVLTATAVGDTDGKPGGLGPASPCFANQQDDTPAFFSDFATLPSDAAHTVAAPGVCIASTAIGDTYGSDSGTSFASPIVAGTVALCIANGPCAGLTPAQIIQKVVADAQAYNVANPGYGFAGDPLRPIAGKYYGYLVRAAAY